MRRCFSVLFIFAVAHFATAKGDIESNLIRVGVDAEHAVIDVTYWPDADNTQTRIIATGVQGSAFLINSDGYFITAAHVLEHYQPNSAHLTVSMKQRDGNGIGARFDVVEKDKAHDLALCKDQRRYCKEIRFG
jgi:S1-C subfamily serine protease